ncbi:hypothetical protein O9929_23345 [Vibrio lentus]|nr:hypothetical protein [Vibrio lentus]
MMRFQMTPIDATVNGRWLGQFDTYTAEQMMPFVALKKDYRSVG